MLTMAAPSGAGGIPAVVTDGGGAADVRRASSRRYLQPAGQMMSAMMGADLGHRCALQHGDGHRELPCEHRRKRLSPGAAQDDRRAG